MTAFKQLAFTDLVDLVSGQERLWVRLGAARSGETWTALAYELVAPVEPPGWRELTWEYPEAVFHAFKVGGRVAAQWLCTGRVSLPVGEVILPGLPRQPPNQQVTVRDLGSKQHYGGYESLPWPTTFYEVSNEHVEVPQDMLVSANSPSFFRFSDAALAFFKSSWDQSPTQLPTPSVRLQHLSGRIAQVTVHPARVDVTIVGWALRGLTVELAGRVPGPQVQLSGSDESEIVSLHTPDGLADEAWIVLKAETTWVDLKSVNRRYSLGRDPDVEFFQEPVSVVETLVAAGEGPQIEFKEQVPTDRDGRKKVCRTLAAFANGSGGHLLFGVGDDGRIAGISPDESSQSVKDTITRWITDDIVPHVDFVLDIVETAEGRAVLLVEIREGVSPPYGVDAANPRYYIRRGATTFPASADDVRAIARARPPTSGPPLGVPRLY